MARSARGTAAASSGGGRRTIAFLSASVHVGAGRSLWPGVADGAELQDVNLICFPGGRLGAPQDFEAQRNDVYDLVGAETVDGIISWASTLTGSASYEEVAAFHRRLSPLPLVSLALPLAGVPALLVDSYLGMRAAVEHLIVAHGRRRPAFLRGPKNHYYAQQRYAAYSDALRAHGIPLDPRLVTDPFRWEMGAAAAAQLLGERGLEPGADFDAIVASNDLMALDALAVLENRGIRVPDGVALVGFNDSDEGRMATPPLTSVSPPFYEQGRRAVDLLLSRLSGAVQPLETVLDTRLTIRESCGCPSRAVMLAGGESPDPGEGAQRPRPARDEMPGAMAGALGDSSPGAARCAALVYDAFLNDVTGATTGAFLAALGEALRDTAARGLDPAAWQAAVSLLWRDSVRRAGGAAAQRAEALCQQARVLTGEVAQRTLGYRQVQSEQQAERLREIGQALVTAFEIDSLAGLMASRLPALGIASGYLALYEEATGSHEWAHLVVGYDERGRFDLPPGGRRYRSQQLVPPDLLPRNRRYSLMVEPLYFRDEPIGFMCLEIGPREGSVYEVLRGLIGSALKGALLFAEAQAARAAAEKANLIKTRLLANVSHELRAPLNIILAQTREALAPQPGAADPSPDSAANLQRIHQSAEHQLRVINDLLDLSRAEIDELDLHTELLDPRGLLADTFAMLADVSAMPADTSASMAQDGEAAGGVTWKLELPERLPMLRADPVRIRQILLNLLSNARKFTTEGQIVLRAGTTPAHLHIAVQDSGAGIPVEQQERIFEPFVTSEYQMDGRLHGIGLGLSITRRLVALHGGSMRVESRPGEGSTFHVYLPWPSISDRPAAKQDDSQAQLIVISAPDGEENELRDLAARAGLAIRYVRSEDDLDDIGAPAVLAWDLGARSPGDWGLLRRLRSHPALAEAPFILYGLRTGGEPGEPAQMVNFLVKPAGEPALLDTIRSTLGSEPSGPALIVDDDPAIVEQYREIVERNFPRYEVRSAADGEAALALMETVTPALVLLDLMLPGIDGFAVLDWMRSGERTRQIPVIILSTRQLNSEDVRRLEAHAQVAFQTKGILSEDEMAAALDRALGGDEPLPRHTSALVKRAIAYLQQNYAHPIARWQVAEAAGASEDYLSRLFHRELGLSPWDYLNRYRIRQARPLLADGDLSIAEVARQVGFKDHAYFSRIFRKLTGLSPNSYREDARRSRAQQ